MENPKVMKGGIKMKNRKILTSILLVLSIGLMLGVVSAQNCTDSDGGLNYGVSGEASRINENNKYTDRCSDKNNLLEAVCGDDGWAAHATYDCSSEGKVCNEGACVNPCSDTDGGKNLLEAGTARFAGKGQGDWCDYSMGENKIREAYCVDDTSFTIELMDCPSDKSYCNKGKCTAEKAQCTEDDSGKNPLVKGTTYPSRIADHTGNTDYCQITSTGQPPANQNQECSGSDCSLREFYCPGGPDESYEDIPCSSGCSDGVCEGAISDSIPCVDSDGGLNYFTKSKATGATYSGGVSVSEVDTCMNENTLREGYCNEKGFVSYKDHSCLNGCLNGKCIRSEGLTCSVDATRCNLEWTELTCGEVVLSPNGFDEYCNIPSPLDGFAGFNFENDGCSKATLCVYGCNNGICSKGETITPISEPKEIPKSNEAVGYFCKGCELENVCYPLGYRKSGNYCSDNFEFIIQLEGDKVCENNFECSSNVCVSGTCISEGLLQKILNWFKNLFG